MTVACQNTLAAPAAFSGVGVHTGVLAHVRVEPAPVDAGICFVRTDLPAEMGEVPARVEAVCETRLGTVIGNPAGATVSTVEHLLASLASLGVDNAVVRIDGPETPIMDGSCAAFVDALDAAGRAAQSARRQVIEVLKPVSVEEGDKRAALLPADRFEVAFEIAFPSAAIGRQSLDVVVTEESFRAELAAARTFGFLHEVEMLRKMGLARGGDLDNTIVVDGDRVMNPNALIRPDDFVRHKMIDAIGDLALLGAPILGRYEGRYSGHALNNALARALLADPTAWRRRDGPAPRAG
ncbi:MAG: UDP-3-O-acyl-N-acetylglucosamine deacetylase [Alphaproteobacteria bacterium]|nr:UDP-3-O-acyl-N-acetylglucosamine deacetylase [Alphaproteobacteria bacterium]